MIINRDTASLEAKVYTELEEAILADEFKKGEALTELGISEKLGVSPDAGTRRASPPRGRRAH